MGSEKAERDQSLQSLIIAAVIAVSYIFIAVALIYEHLICIGSCTTYGGYLVHFARYFHYFTSK